MTFKILRGLDLENVEALTMKEQGWIRGESQLVQNTKTTLLEQSSIIYFLCPPVCLIVCQPPDNLITTQLSFDYLAMHQVPCRQWGGGGDVFLLTVKHLWGNMEAYLW